MPSPTPQKPYRRLQQLPGRFYSLLADDAAGYFHPRSDTYRRELFEDVITERKEKRVPDCGDVRDAYPATQQGLVMRRVMRIRKAHKNRL